MFLVPRVLARCLELIKLRVERSPLFPLSFSLWVSLLGVRMHVHPLAHEAQRLRESNGDGFSPDSPLDTDGCAEFRIARLLQNTISWPTLWVTVNLKNGACCLPDGIHEPRPD